MDVDQVGQVSKRKDKGGKKGGEGKKGGWFPFGYNSSKYGGKSFKGKGKKGKGKKGKSKYGGRGRGKGGNVNNNTRHVCGQQGHWANECPNKAQTVTQQSLAESDIASSAGGKARSTTASSIASTNVPKTVRQVTLYHVAAPGEEQETPILYEIQSEGGDSAIFDDHYKINVVSVSVSQDSETDENFDNFIEDKTNKWYYDLQARCYVMQDDQMEDDEEKPELFHVGMVKMSQEKMLIVLDSGADCSVLPKEVASRGQPQDGGKAILEDAQTQLKTHGRKLAQVKCDLGMARSVTIEDDFIVASVQTPLVGLGRLLLQRGWRLTQGNCEAGVNLVAPDQKCEIPLFFKKNSLALYGCINRVHEGPE